jgi:mycothiol synthase
LSDHLWLDLAQGGREGFAGLLAWEPGHDHPVAYAQVSKGNGSWALELVIDPHHRYEAMDIGPELLSAALDIIRNEGGGHVHWWVFEPTSAHSQMAEAVGLRPGRQLYQMRCALPLAERSTITTRAFRPGHDEAAWLEVNNRAFAKHPEQGDWNLEVFLARQREAWFDPNGFRLYEVDGRLAGFCWTKLHHDTEPVLGEIYVIAVDPDFHGKGLGRQLTLAGLESIASRRITTGMLFVDADNTAAVSLYRSLGFTTHRTDGAYVGDL